MPRRYKSLLPWNPPESWNKLEQAETSWNKVKHLKSTVPLDLRSNRSIYPQRPAFLGNLRLKVVIAAQTVG